MLIRTCLAFSGEKKSSRGKLETQEELSKADEKSLSQVSVVYRSPLGVNRRDPHRIIIIIITTFSSEPRNDSIQIIFMHTLIFIHMALEKRPKIHDIDNLTSQQTREKITIFSSIPSHHIKNSYMKLKPSLKKGTGSNQTTIGEYNDKSEENNKRTRRTANHHHRHHPIQCFSTYIK